MMKQVPISRFLNMTLEDFLDKVGAVHNKGSNGSKTSYPSWVYISDEDAAKLKRANRRKFRAEKPYLRKRYIDDAVGAYWLMYGPSTVVGGAVRPGYALVDVEKIEKDIELSKKPQTYSYEITAVEAPVTWKTKLYNFITLNWI